jgi:Lon protease-like protein
MNATDWLPLFPLRTVLFPGGVLPLRVFETRYVDMVRERMKADAPFGVVAIRSGAEVGKAAEPCVVGTLAHIVEWDMPELGVLLLETRGGERFKVLETRVQANQLIEAKIEMLASSTDIPYEDALPVCGDVLETVINDFMDQSREQADQSFVNPFPEPHQLHSASWVANRWSEMLPITIEEKQALLEILDDGARLLKIEQYLRENRII